MLVRNILLGTTALVGVAVVGTPQAAADACTPPRLMMVLDKSSSMQTGTIGGQTKWSIAVNALDSVTSEFQTKVEMGLMTFPAPSQCSPGDVKVAPALNTRTEMLSALAAPPPTAGNWTPMAQTLEAAATEPTLVFATGQRYAVVVTDGWQWCDPYDSATRFTPVEAVNSLNAAGVTTYVVGFGDSVDALTLNMMALEAGTARPGCDPSGNTPTAPNPCYFRADNPAQLTAALTQIVGEVSVEICDGLDNDCDGEVDEDLVRSCGSACGVGVESCTGGSWGGCTAPQPDAEICDGLDNDCNGEVDPGCDCTPGETRACGETLTEGACQPGTQTCDSVGTWGSCEGSVGPVGEMCDGLDNDCDGTTDEMDDDVGNLCGPGLVCMNGNCEEIDPVPPVTDDPMDPALDDGTPASNCACTVGGKGGYGDLAGGGVLFLLGFAFIGVRRRRRTN